MIISASRRTDLLAFYTSWFIHRVRAGFCTVSNPYNPHQITRVSLNPAEVSVIVFWTRNPRSFFPYLKELDDYGFRYYFQYTLMDYPRIIEPKTPSVEQAIRDFRKLSEQIGPERVVWRYDPIIFTKTTSASYHRERYAMIAKALRGNTYRSVISLLDIYPKVRKRFRQMEQQGVRLIAPNFQFELWFGDLMRDLASIANDNGMEIVSCAEQIDLEQYGVRPGKCVDDDYIQRVFGLEVSHLKDPNQREACGCVVSKDIGMYESCPMGCLYCYAVSNFERAKENFLRHDSNSPSLL